MNLERRMRDWVIFFLLIRLQQQPLEKLLMLLQQILLSL
ncbi:hypothetical protein AsAng_0064560 (plasmid) [Aureispira anguillae]|uniref:Uncharacterized protein n=1 Tax=Aureispira anguillae TaxID=2864201 RepID=A0A916DXA8_9BACT|nr:hypothetical protein AsAng_0064560 [Aureispira anguillae]